MTGHCHSPEWFDRSRITEFAENAGGRGGRYINSFSATSGHSALSAFKWYRATARTHDTTHSQLRYQSHE